MVPLHLINCTSSFHPYVQLENPSHLKSNSCKKTFIPIISIYFVGQQNSKTKSSLNGNGMLPKGLKYFQLNWCPLTGKLKSKNRTKFYLKMFNHTVYGKYTTTTPEPFQFHLTLLHLKTFFSLETMRKR